MEETFRWLKWVLLYGASWRITTAPPLTSGPRHPTLEVTMSALRRLPHGALTAGGVLLALALLAATDPLLAGDEKQEESAVLTLGSGIKRLVVARVPHQADLLEGLERAVQKEGLKSAAILSGAGSLTRYHLHSVADTTFPPD
jgi:hypothetical protein